MQRSENPSREAQLILSTATKQPRSWLLAHPEFFLESQFYKHANKMLAAYLEGSPLPYVLGHWEFFGLDLLVTPDVLIPRPETELLVETALDWLRRHPNRNQVADVGTGSGCIAIALARQLPGINIVGLDISSQALTVAAQNVKVHNLTDRISLVQSDLAEALTAPVDVVCANLPYIPSETLAELDVAKNEPHLALDGGEDGLRLVEQFLAQLVSGNLCRGLVLLEIEARQGQSASALAKAYFPAANVEVKKDLAGHDRLVIIEME